MNLSETTNYHLFLSDDENMRFQNWREKLSGVGDSNMVKIDAALAGIQEELSGATRSTKWIEYAGEGLGTLQLYAAETLQDALKMKEADLVPLRAGGGVRAAGSENGFRGDVFHYEAAVSPRAACLAISADSAAYLNRFIDIRVDGGAGSVEELPAAAAFPMPTKTEAALTLVAKSGASGGGETDKTYQVAIQRPNEIMFRNLWVTDSAAKPEDNAHNLERVWRISPEAPGDANYQAGAVDTGAHDIFDPDISHGAVSYGVMVDTLQTELKLNLEAPDLDGARYAIVVSEVGAKLVQRISTEKDTSKGALVDQVLRLDPSQNGTQTFQCVIVDRETGAAGACWLTIFRYGVESGVEPQLQTYIKGYYVTSDTWGAEENHTVTVTLYKKSGAMGLMSVDEMVANAENPVTLPDGTENNYTNRFDAVVAAGHLTNVWQTVTGKDGKYLIEPNTQRFTSPGTYMLVVTRAGYLDSIIDNILVYKTWVLAEYDMGKNVMRAGDVNHDGIVDEKDDKIFSENFPMDFDPSNPLHVILDFNGDGILANSDLNYLLSHRGLTANRTCRLDNAISKYRTLLGPYKNTGEG